VLAQRTNKPIERSDRSARVRPGESRFPTTHPQIRMDLRLQRPRTAKVDSAIASCVEIGGPEPTSPRHPQASSVT
jgi:hypothetical protein